MEFLRVKASSNPSSVAGAIAGVFREEGKAGVQVVGAAAVNQAVKAIAIARGFVAPQGYDLICVPCFDNTEIEGEEKTVIKFIIEQR